MLKIKTFESRKLSAYLNRLSELNVESDQTNGVYPLLEPILRQQRRDRLDAIILNPLLLDLLQVLV